LVIYSPVSATTAAAPFGALSDPARRLILELLRERERPVNELVERLRLSQPGVSKHLRVLREAGLVSVRPDGRQRWYGLRAEPLAELDAWLAPYREFWGGRLDALERHLDEEADK
jgi:DNA-binding transcriptional ArsR family regulator